MSVPSPPPVQTPPAPLPEAPLPVLGHISSRWTPPDDMPLNTHAGDPVTPGRVYLAAPPEEIGKLLSVTSNMDSEKGADAQIGKRLLSALGGFAGGMLILGYIQLRGRFSMGTLDAVVFYGLAGIVGAIVGYITARPKYETSYVGEKGVAKYHYGGNNKTIGKVETFLFDHGANLLVQQTNNHYNGVYTGTTYQFLWNDAAGKPIYKINGTHKNKAGMPPPEDPFWYAVAAETAWSRAKLPALIEQINRGETVRFPVKGKGTVGISPEGIVIEIGNKREVMPFNVLGDFGIKGGMVTIKRIGAKDGFLGIGKDGVYTFPYASFGNAGQFLALLSAVAGSSGESASADAPSPDTW